VDGVAEILPYAIGVAISPVPIIAVILVLFSGRAKVNGPMFLLGWAVALAVVSGIAFATGEATSESTTEVVVSWSKVLVGVLFLLLAARSWRSRPAPGDQADSARWMAGIDSFSPGKALVLALLLAEVNSKNLLLAAGADGAVAGLGCRGSAGQHQGVAGGPQRRRHDGAVPGPGDEPDLGGRPAPDLTCDPERKDERWTSP
jgi:hypothetical protein